MKKPRFFCDNCGVEVGRDTKTCPNCGRFFASVCCPKCGFTGAEGLFASGCPSCGYSASGASPSNFSGSGGRNDRWEAAGALPIWVYILTALALICVLGIILYYLPG